MNLWLRLIWLVLASRLRPSLSAPSGVSELRFRVWPNDVDLSMHMNNGRYWTLMDLGRMDLILRTGLWRKVLAKRWTPIVNAGEIRFRRELRPLARFRLTTAIAAWTEAHVVIEHRFLSESGAVAAIALVRVAFYDRSARGFVPVTEIMKGLGDMVESPPPSPAVAAFLAAEEALKAVTALSARRPRALKARRPFFRRSFALTVQGRSTIVPRHEDRDAPHQPDRHYLRLGEQLARRFFFVVKRTAPPPADEEDGA